MNGWSELGRAKTIIKWWIFWGYLLAKKSSKKSSCALRSPQKNRQVGGTAKTTTLCGETEKKKSAPERLSVVGKLPVRPAVGSILTSVHPCFRISAVPPSKSRFLVRKNLSYLRVPEVTWHTIITNNAACKDEYWPEIRRTHGWRPWNIFNKKINIVGLWNLFFPGLWTGQRSLTSRG